MNHKEDVERVTPASVRSGPNAVAIIGLLVAGLLAGCSGDDGAAPAEVVVFATLDRVYSEPLLQQFEAQSGIHVRVKYDAEAAKTTGLINQILARRDDPECDVLWSNELLQTEHLARMGMLQTYASPEAERFDARFRDPNGQWTAFAARARVIIYNTDLLELDEVPRTLQAFADPKWRGKAAIAMPFFGTTLTHMGMLREAWGEAPFVAWLHAIQANDIMVAPGNGPVRDLVASGECWFGLTDTDDAHGAMLDGKPVAILIPDRELGVALIPNGVALIAKSSRAEAGRALIDFLLSADVERALAAGRSAQIPLARDLVDLETPFAALRDAPVLAALTAGSEERDHLVALLREAGFDR